MSGPNGSRHPALSDTLVHFTSRAAPRADLPGAIADMSPEQRLEEIIRGERIQGFSTYWSCRPVVCMSESRDEDITHLLTDRGWQPWGLFFSAADVERAGGGPVWYARSEQWDQVRGMDPGLAADLGQWMVRWDVGPQRLSDWRHEREWRVPGAVLDLRVVPPVGVLVGDPSWQFRPDDDLVPGRLGNYPQDWIPGYPPEWLSGLARWCWNRDSRQLVRLGP